MSRGIGFTFLALMTLPILSCGCSDQGSPRSVTPPPRQLISEEVSWIIDETSVAATITRPDSPGPHPAIVFVPGSGPTDRDWNTPLLPGTNGSARLLAEELAKQGFVTLRYDKRFTGPQAQRNLPFLVGKISMASHQEELAGAVNQLTARPDVNLKQVFVVANSEGNIHALNYQLERTPRFAGMVLIAPPGQDMRNLIHSQIEAQLKNAPNGSEILAGFDSLLADFLADKPFTADPGLPESLNNLVQSFYAPVNLPFTRELFKIDVSRLLTRVNAPVLVIIGKKDIQVDYLLDGGLLEKAARSMESVTFNYPENSNHVLKHETKPREELTGTDSLNYNSPDRTLDAEALQTIKDWLDKQLS